MDNSAIQEISRLAVEAALANRILLPAAPGVLPAIFHNGQVISLESFQKGRSRFRGAFFTNVMSEFAGYVKAHTGGHGFIDADKVTARVFHNLGDDKAPGHGDWTSTLALKPTAAYAAMLAVENKQLTQKQLVEWIEDWSPQLQSKFSGETETKGIGVALSAIRDLTISAKSDVTHTDKDFGAGRSCRKKRSRKTSRASSSRA